MALALAARVAMLAYAERAPERFDYPDSRRYALVARHIAQGRGPIESESNRTGTDPLYPMLMCLAYLRAGATSADAYTVARWFNVAFGMMAAAAVMGIARRLDGELTGVLAGLVVAVDPILLFFHGLPLTETAYNGLLWASLYFALRNRERPAPLLAVAAGAMGGLAVLMRSSGLPLAYLVPVLAYVAGEGRRWERLTTALLMAAATTIVLVPTARRNQSLLGRWVPVRTGSGATLLESFGPWADGGPGMQKVAWPAVPAGASEYERDAVYRAAALRWAREHPAEVVRLAWAKLRRTWSVTVNVAEYQSPAYAVIGWLTVAPVYVLAVRGAWLCRARWRMLAFLLAPAASVSLLHMIFVGSVRYRLPAMPGLMILAAAGLAPWLAGMRGCSRQGQGATAG